MAQRNTVQQKIIAGQLAKLHGSHPTADEVYQSMKDEYPSISRATVYRNLNKMSDNGQALKVRVSSGADHFDDTLRPTTTWYARNAAASTTSRLTYQAASQSHWTRRPRPVSPSRAMSCSSADYAPHAPKKGRNNERFR